MDNKKKALFWVKKAKDDLLWTEANIKEKIYFGACFTSQQTVEKALKAYLVYKGESVKKIHDLGALLEICAKFDASFSDYREKVLPLVDYYTQARYPEVGDFVDYTEPKAKEAYLVASEILEFVETKLR
ncbi:HEPN domain-containing protein [Candidatus Woesebacteria bacterium]|nr:HEPN domain-containing protein [Candidatus Woesebacteria bacterium]